jgi:hypothetical protein
VPLIGAAVCFVYVFGISWVFFVLYKRFFGLHVSAATELKVSTSQKWAALATIRMLSSTSLKSHWRQEALPSLVAVASKTLLC